MEPYLEEDFTPQELGRLRPFVSNLEGPVFVLRNLPQVTCAALFARYSRSSKSLRRLLLDEFLPGEDQGPEESGGEAGRGRARDLFGRVLAEYGDDSVAQLAGVHLACEQVTQPLAKAIEWGRLASYLEQSTRYINYGDRPGGNYRYFRDPQILRSPLADKYLQAMDGLFATYVQMQEPLRRFLDASLPPQADTAARSRAIRALALDHLRGLLPAGTVSNVGVFASPQALEQLVMRLRAHELPEAQVYAGMIAYELQKEIPEFLSRLDRPDRGGAWVEYLRETTAAVADGAPPTPAETGVRLLEFDADAEAKIIAGWLFPGDWRPLGDVRAAVDAMSGDEKDALFRRLVGERGNRRHKPGRALEHAQYVFEVVSDYGAFRDLQRHRMLTLQWQPLTPRLGYAVPAAVAEAGLEGGWRAAVTAAEDAYAALHPDFPQQAAYLVTLGHRVRYLLRLNAREAMHLIELRSSPQAHPAYREIALAMHRCIDEVAGHHRLAQAMSFVGREDVYLPRYAAEAKS